LCQEEKISASNFRRGTSEHHRVGYFLTGSLGNKKPAPQKQTALLGKGEMVV